MAKLIYFNEPQKLTPHQIKAVKNQVRSLTRIMESHQKELNSMNKSLNLFKELFGIGDDKNESDFLRREEEIFEKENIIGSYIFKMEQIYSEYSAIGLPPKPYRLGPLVLMGPIRNRII